MKNETDFKRIFKFSVRKHGGYYLPLPMPVMSGQLDAYCIMPGFIPVLLEAKYLGELGDTFNRKINYSSMQKFIMDSCNEVYKYAAWGLIGFYHKNMYYCCLVHPKHGRIDSNLNVTDMFYVCNLSRKEFAVGELFNKSCIGKIDPRTPALSPDIALDKFSWGDTMER